MLSERPSKRLKTQTPEMSFNEPKSYTFQAFHQIIYDSSSIFNAAEALSFSVLELIKLLSKINVDFIELKILNKDNLKIILGERYNEQLTINNKYELYKFALQVIHDQLKLNNYPPYFFSTDDLNQIFQLYLHRFLLEDEFLTINKMQESNLDISKIQKIDNLALPSVAEIHFLNSVTGGISQREATRFLDTTAPTIKGILKKIILEEIPLSFEKLKKTPFAEALKWDRKLYYGKKLKYAREKEKRRFLDCTFKEIHTIVQTSNSPADAASKLGIEVDELWKCLNKANLRYFELFFLDAHEIKKDIGHKYEIPINNSTYDLRFKTFNKIYNTRSLKPFTIPSENNIFSRDIYLANFFYHGQPINTSMLMNPGFKLSEVRNANGQPLAYDLSSISETSPSTISTNEQSVAIHPSSFTENPANHANIIEIDSPNSDSSSFVETPSNTATTSELVSPETDFSSFHVTPSNTTSNFTSSVPLNSCDTSSSSQLLPDPIDFNSTASTQPISIINNSSISAPSEVEVFDELNHVIKKFIRTLPDETVKDTSKFFMNHLKQLKSQEVKRKLDELNSLDIPYSAIQQLGLFSNNNQQTPSVTSTYHPQPTREQSANRRK